MLNIPIRYLVPLRTCADVAPLLPPPCARVLLWPPCFPPCQVVSVSPLSSCCRLTAPFPPQPHPLAGGPPDTSGPGPRGRRHLARCLQPVEVMLQLENSGGWLDGYFTLGT